MHSSWALRLISELGYRFYTCILSPGIQCLLGIPTAFCCRFEPTCSCYAKEALREWGFWRGGILVIWRLLRCHPLARAGDDPVPRAIGNTCSASHSQKSKR